jgi:hypothetical protein
LGFIAIAASVGWQLLKTGIIGEEPHRSHLRTKAFAGDTDHPEGIRDAMFFSVSKASSRLDHRRKGIDRLLSVRNSLLQNVQIS